MSTSPGHPALARRLGTLDATVIGVGSMVGAGVFVAFAPAAGFAGPWLPLASLPSDRRPVPDPAHDRPGRRA